MPLLVDLQPAGRHLMEDFHRAGGLLAVLREVRDLLDPDALTVTGRPLVDYLDEAQIWDETVIRPRDEPLQSHAGIAVLYGNLAPGGAVIKPAAASPRAAAATAAGPSSSTASRTCTPASTTPTSTWTPPRCSCCAAAAPRATRGCRRWRTCRCRPSSCEQGVRDMVRICDGRMSGTAYGTVVLHVAPEAAAGGPLGLVETGDPIILDVEARRLELDIPQRDLEQRKPSAAMQAGFAAPARGWERLYVDHVMQADQGADLDFLVGSSGHQVSRESH